MLRKKTILSFLTFQDQDMPTLRIQRNMGQKHNQEVEGHQQERLLEELLQEQLPSSFQSRKGSNLHRGSIKYTERKFQTKQIIPLVHQFNYTVQKKIKNEQIEKRGEVFKIQQDQFIVQDSKGYKKVFFEKGGIWNQEIFTGEKPKIEPVNIRCPDSITAVQIYKEIQNAKRLKDSLGGVVQGGIYNLPIGLGSPSFDKLPALMAHAMLSLPATKGFQYGSGFEGVKMLGSEHNDVFEQNLSLKTNFSGGTLGGISTGQTFSYKVAFKPVSTIGKEQITHDFEGKKVTLQAKGRHDPCVLPRAPPIVDNMAAIVIMDLLLCKRAGI